MAEQGGIFDAEPVLARLTTFQRATVDHVVRRFYGEDNPCRRFLVADETGLGKSLVARGVIARTIEHLEHDPSVDRIDIVYVCSNAEIAQQNINRLDVTGDPTLPLASRLTLLPTYAHRLGERPPEAATKPINLISFTPGTSFDMGGWQTGKVEERALLFVLLEERLPTAGYGRTAALRLLQGPVQTLDRFKQELDRLSRDNPDGPAGDIRDDFLRTIEDNGLLSQFLALVDEVGQRRNLPLSIRRTARQFIGRLRGDLARASLDALEPDLVILDEFQRFRHLLDRQNGGEAADLAHQLFDYGQARVLLLSATPYKPFTYAEETAFGDDHYRDFQQTLTFLAEGCPEMSVEDIGRDLTAYRDALLTGGRADELAQRIRERLTLVMCRTERPQLFERAMLAEHVATAVPVDGHDLRGYVSLRRLARAVDAQLPIDYWKSAPYFINFMDGYQLHDKVSRRAHEPEISRLLADTQHMDRDAIRQFEPVDLGHARLRQLAAETVDRGWWQLLWIPPSLPYTAPGGPYAEPWAQDVTKRLVFSSWLATPTAVAALLSYEADRHIAHGRLQENTPAARESMATRLTYRLDGNRPAAMTTLLLFWPTPGLARLADPLLHATKDPDHLLTAAELEQLVVDRLPDGLPADEVQHRSGGEAWYSLPLSWPESLPGGLEEHEITMAMAGRSDDDDEDVDHPESAGLQAHVAAALAGHRQWTDPTTARPSDLASTVAAIAAHAPGNVAWRALGRLRGGEVTDLGHWRAAAVLAAGLRTLFARPEAVLLLESLQPPDQPYWRTVLRYCAWGNLQAVLDEHLHHLAGAEGISEVRTDDELMTIAVRARVALILRPSLYKAFDPGRPGEAITLASRFALRYGTKRRDDDEARQPHVRAAFNSPFWPFVLATTSIGQEGLDFHWWSHAIVHWNTPANAVDFEQREGRVFRYAGHAVRRNLVRQHRADILRSPGRNPWTAAYTVAAGDSSLGEFAPHWIFPGPARIQRHVSPYPLSSDEARYQRIKDDLVLYRLTLGQPRQEDMLDLLRRSGVNNSGDVWARARIDLRPPR